MRRVDRASKSKVVHFIHIRHRDEVEAPITDWLREAYELSDAVAQADAQSKTRSKREENAAARKTVTLSKSKRPRP